MDVFLASQSARSLRAFFVATSLWAALPITALAQGFDPPPAPSLPSAVTQPATQPAGVKKTAPTPVRWERLPPVEKRSGLETQPTRVLERLPPVETKLLNPAKVEKKTSDTTAAAPVVMPQPTTTKPIAPSTRSEPTVLLKRTPPRYAELATQRADKFGNAEPKDLDVVNSLPRVSAISENQLVKRHIQAGFALAHRGAYYSAKREFEQALRVVAESLDAQQVDGKHGQQLTAAFDAIAEADEFFVDDPQTGGRQDLRNVAVTHRTPLLRDGKLEGMNQMTAMQAYYAYAQEQLNEAVGTEVIAAEALYGLGRTYTALAGADGAVSRLHGPKSLLMHQVAAQVNPNHPLAANELGVLLARFGQWEEAKQALLQAPKQQRLPECWHNLAVVHEHLGEKQLADAAERESMAVLQQRSTAQAAPIQDNGVEWYDVSAAETMARQQAPAEKPTPRAATRPASSYQWPWSTPR